MTAPPLREHLHAVVEGLLTADGLLLALDFDGTLAPITALPDAATVHPVSETALSTLVEDDRVSVAVVSGRQLADLRERIEATTHVGNHGMELHHGNEVWIPSAAEETAQTVNRACTDLENRLGDIDGTIVENKGVTATIHYRRVDEQSIPTVERVVDDVAQRHDELRVTEGKMILELRPDIDWNKGDAVEWLDDRLVPGDERWVTIYVGDERTDEDAFEALSADDLEIGIKVGTDETAASYRVDDADAVAEFLDWLAAYGVTFLDLASAATSSLPES